MKELLRRWLLDPLARRVASRIAHFDSLRSSTHDGSRWRARARIGAGVVFYEEAALVCGSDPAQLQIGDFCHVRGELSVLGNGRLTLGDHCFVGPGSRLWCRHRIQVGSHVLISHLVDIHDSSSHALDWRLRRAEGKALFESGTPASGEGVEVAPVTIGDDVWIGLKATILAGVSLGRGAVVAAGSVVTRDVGEFELVAGNPARVVRELPR